jgi:hypothetical protein
MRAYGAVEVYLHSFLTSVHGCKWTAARAGHFIPGERASCVHWTADWAECTGGTDVEEKMEFQIETKDAHPCNYWEAENSSYLLQSKTTVKPIILWKEFLLINGSK